MLVVQLNKNYDTKTSEFGKKLTDHNHGKFITTPEFNTLAADVFNARLAKANLITKTDFDAKLSSLNKKITANKSNHLVVENEMKKLKTFDSTYIIGKSHFEEDGAQNYLVFQPMYRYFKIIAGARNGSYIYYWISKGLSDEKSNSIKTCNHSITPKSSYYGTKTRVEFNGSCLKQDMVTFKHGKIVNIYIVYEISENIDISDYPTLENCLFGSVIFTKNADFDKYKYSGYGIGFDRHGNFSFLDIGLGRNVITFGVDISAFVHIDNKKKDILILGKGPTQGLEHSLTAEKMYLINFAKHNKMFCMSLHNNRASSYIFVTSKEIHKFKAKDSEIVATPLCLGSISSISVDNMKETGLNGYVYDFSVD